MRRRSLYSTFVFEGRPIQLPKVSSPFNRYVVNNKVVRSKRTIQEALHNKQIVGLFDKITHKLYEFDYDTVSLRQVSEIDSSIDHSEAEPPKDNETLLILFEDAIVEHTKATSFSPKRSHFYFRQAMLYKQEILKRMEIAQWRDDNVKHGTAHSQNEV